MCIGIMYMCKINVYMFGGEKGITIKKRNANKTILLQMFLRDVVSGLVPDGEKQFISPYIGATS